MANGWKITAIIFMVLFSLLLIGNIVIFNWSYDEIEKENICSIEKCSNADYYTYGSGTCICYDWDEELYDYKLKETFYIK